MLLCPCSSARQPWLSAVLMAGWPPGRGLRLSSQDYTYTLLHMPQPFPKSHLTCLVFLLHRDARELTCTANTRPQTAKANKYFSRQLKMHGVQLNETTLPHIWAATDTCFGPSRSGDKQQHRHVPPSLCCSTRGNGLPLGEPATRVLDVKFQKLMADSADPFLIIT